MNECDYCIHVEMCGWRKELEERGCDFFDGGNKWISVSERLPDIHDYCMKYLVTDCYRHIHTSLFTESGGKGRWSRSDVIAWMPLPAPFDPQESEDKE